MAKSSQKLTFPGAYGAALAARLDLPAGPPKAYALFAHCFTCSKDIFAAARIAGELTNHGFAVLRFDFTGLGKSEGEFANTNFSSNVADLLAAANFLREAHEAPQILIGHSLGGAAVLVAAEDIPEAKAIATIGAPADAEHVIHNFGAQVDEIDEKGVAEVSLAGRTFTIRKAFLDDVRSQNLSDKIAHLKKALLVFHAPLDQTVGIENATSIFVAAKHPKSFVSLDGADHLLSRRTDAAYVASVLSAWADRFIDTGASDETPPTKPPVDAVRIVETDFGKFQQKVHAGGHTLLADEPVSFGGDDTGPSPYEYLSTALGTCTSMTIRMYADRKSIPLDKVRVDVTHEKIHAKDCADCGDGKEGRIDRFERKISLAGDMSEEQRDRLIKIADRCPVHLTLEKGAAIVTEEAE